MDVNNLYRFRNWEVKGALAVDLTSQSSLRMENETFSATQLWYFEPVSPGEKTYRIRNIMLGPCSYLAQTLGNASHRGFSAQVTNSKGGPGSEWLVYPLYADNTTHLILENKVGLTLIADWGNSSDVYPIRENRERPTLRAYWRADVAVRAPWAKTC
jgi:hypothetical protein